MLLNPYVFTTGVGVGGVSYFFEERFEGTGYQNTWTESGTGTIDEDYTTSPLEGSQSLRIAATTQQPRTDTTFTSDQAELWGYFRFRINVATGNNRNIFLIRNSSAVQVFALLLATDNGFQAIHDSAHATATTVDKLTTATNYNVWWHWKKSTGTDGQASVGFSTSGTEVTAGNAFKSLVNGVATTNAHDLRVGAATINHTFEFVIDQILISTTGTIGNSPA